MMPRFPFDNSYARLPPRFFARVQPTPVATPGWVRFNRPLAVELGLESDPHAEDAAFFAGNRLPEGAEPLSMAYAGHQFGHFVPQLGDGRAILLGEVIDRHGVRRDIQLKGSGPTPFSRRGDGRAALGPVLREYIVSEAMTALGVPSTRALAAVTTGQIVQRETALPGAVLTRVAASHLRIGTFQFFAARGDTEAVRRLADFAIERHDPAARTAAHPYRALLEGVIGRQAALVAQWLSIGFIHGVMNTDNTSISGETIDFGPCAFLDTYDPATVFSSIDQGGRYAYGNQPPIMQWNLARLAETLLPLLADDPSEALAFAEEAIEGFTERFAAEFRARFRAKLGLFNARTEDIGLMEGLLDIMARHGADFTLTFRRLCAAAVDPGADADVRRLFDDTTAYDAWALDWRRRLDVEPQTANDRQTLMRGVNPAVIPRNHRVEAVITAAVEHGDLAPFEDLLAAVCDPYSDRFPDYQSPPTPDERVTRTFCGT